MLERRTLGWVLLVNFAQAVLVGVAGVLAESTGLIGAALDNLGDAAVYVGSIYAVGRSTRTQSRVATASGALLILTALALIVEVGRRYFTGSDPIGLAMIIVALANAGANILSLALLRSHREHGVHIKASWIFTSNDMLANAGIAVSGAAVMLFDSPLPDLIIGLIVAVMVLKGGWDILREAREQRAPH